MFVSKKRYEAETKRLERMNANLESELREADGEVDRLAEKLAKVKNERNDLATVMQEILDSKTPSSNGTTLRIMRQISEALDRLAGIERAEFVTDAPQPEGTLADLRRHFMGRTTGTVAPVATATPARSNLDYTYAYVPAFTPTYDDAVANADIAGTGYVSGGGDFGGGGATGSWSNDSCSSSSYDSGSSSYDSGSSCDSGGGSFD